MEENKNIALEKQFDIQKQYRDHQQKYVYYLIALSVSAIGFSIFKTSGLPLKLTQIPLAISILCWSGSIYFGLKFLKIILNALWTSNAYFDIVRDKNPITQDDPIKKQIGINATNEKMKNLGVISSKNFSWQGKLFYSGMIFFIAWHLIEMYLLSKQLNMSCH